jgi:hypothetical protein
MFGGMIILIVTNIPEGSPKKKAGDDGHLLFGFSYIQLLRG